MGVRSGDAATQSLGMSKAAADDRVTSQLCPRDCADFVAAGDARATKDAIAAQ
jgi:hypothetical protein